MSRTTAADATATVGVMPRARASLRGALLAGLVGAAVQAAVTVPLLGRYGWDRDELYFRSAGRHPTLGYVDFPPLTAWLAWLVDRIAPDSLVALRAASLTLGAVTIVLVALIARELGGRQTALYIAALGWASTPYILGSASVFHPTWLDAAAWVTLLYLLTRILVRDEQHLWPLLGVVAGIGLEAKYTIAMLLVGIALALLLTHGRRLLLSPGPWLAAIIALALLVPNLVWQARHGWPSVQFFASQNDATASDTSPLDYLAEQLLFLGGALVLSGFGVLHLWRRPPLRPLALVPVIVTVLFLAERGRAYYPLPADAAAVAAGAVTVEHWLATRLDKTRAALLAAIVALQALALVFAAPIVVPIHSTSGMVRSGVWKTGFYDDEIGWPELSSQVKRAWASLPGRERAHAAVLAHNYGEASALAYYDPRLPVLSGHLSWQYWRPKSLPETDALLVGYQRGDVLGLCSSWHVLARIDNRWHLDNEEHGRPIALCHLTHPLARLWQPLVARSKL